jgi:hypothetical protein
VAPTGRAISWIGAGVAGFLLYRAAEQALGTVRTVAALNRAAGTADTPTADAAPRAGRLPNIVLLLPMLREDRRIGEACRHLLKAMRANPRISAVIITGASEHDGRAAAQRVLLAMAGDAPRDAWREAATRAVTAEAVPAVAAAWRARDRERMRRLLTRHRRPTTGEVAEPLVAELNGTVGRPAFQHIPLADDGGTKVAKLNQALARWRTQPDAHRSPTYLGVYDADSLPDLSVFARLDAEVARRSGQEGALPEIFQQVSCYCGNLRSLSGVGGLFSLADAMAQTWWALGFEYPMYRRYAAAVTGNRTRPLVHCVGHGCFVASDFLDRIGGFPAFSPTDDLALGYLASTLGAQVAPIPALDYCDVAPDPVRGMRQQSFWFAGSARFWRDLRYARDRYRPEVSRRQWIGLHLAGATRTLAWAGQGPAWAGAVALAAATRRWRLLGLLGVAHLAYVQGGYLQTRWALHRLPGAAEAVRSGEIPRRRWAGGCLAASGNFLLRSLGPLAGALAAGRRGTPSWKQER